MSFSYTVQVLDYNGGEFMILKSPGHGYRLRDLRPFDTGGNTSGYGGGTTTTKTVKLLAIWEKYEEQE